MMQTLNILWSHAGWPPYWYSKLNSSSKYISEWFLKHASTYKMCSSLISYLDLTYTFSVGFFASEYQISMTFLATTCLVHISSVEQRTVEQWSRYLVDSFRVQPYTYCINQLMDSFLFTIIIYNNYWRVLLCVGAVEQKSRIIRTRRWQWPTCINTLLVMEIGVYTSWYVDYVVLVQILHTTHSSTG